MVEAVIVDAVRTPMGKRHGSLSGWHPVELAGEVLRDLGARTRMPLEHVDDVIMGCVTQVAEQSTNIARNAVLAAGWPQTIPGVTLDRQCGSSQQAIHFAAQAIQSGAMEVVVAAGVEAMSSIPMFSNTPGGDLRAVYGDVVQNRYAARDTYGVSGLVPQGLCAEVMAEKWTLSRAELDAYGLRSQQRAQLARAEGRFDSEIVPMQRKVRDPDTGRVTILDGVLDSDEPIRETSVDKLAALKPVFRSDGVVTAGNASQIVDGAAALLMMSRAKADDLGFKPLAAVREMVVVADDPVLMLSAPIPATRKILEKARMSVDDIDLFEVNEAFASVVLAWQRELDVDDERLNVNGGGISLGHPLGASGARLMVTLVHELNRRGGRFGLQTMCESGGMANATIVERLA